MKALNLMQSNKTLLRKNLKTDDHSLKERILQKKHAKSTPAQIDKNKKEGRKAKINKKIDTISAKIAHVQNQRLNINELQ